MDKRFAAAAFLLATTVLPHPARAASAEELDRSARSSLKTLYARNVKAKTVSGKAIAVLVFPSVTKAGLGVGGQYGEGVLYKKGKVAGYYNTAGASVGLQAGGQVYGYAMFFLSDSTLAYLDASKGFEVGVGPSVVMGDEGTAKSATTTTTKDAIYAFVFDQKGAMAALGLQGNKISRIKK